MTIEITYRIVLGYYYYSTKISKYYDRCVNVSKIYSFMSLSVNIPLLINIFHCTYQMI